MNHISLRIGRPVIREDGEVYKYAMNLIQLDGVAPTHVLHMYFTFLMQA